MDADARNVLENGVREIAGEVRNSLDFHRSQDGGGEVSHVVLSGSALDLPGFAEALEAHLGLEVRTETVRLADESSADMVSMHRLAVAAGLATTEVHPMRAVNLIPVDQRGGSGPAAGRSEGGAYAVLVLLAGLALLALLYGMARHEISSRRAKAASLAAQTQRAQATVAQLAPYTSFLATARTAREGRLRARPLALRLGPRLPRARSRAARRCLDHLAHGDGRIGVGEHLPPAPLRLRLNGRARQRRRHLGDPAGQRPHVHPQRVRDEPVRGRADAQPPAPDRRRQRSDAAELHQAEREAEARPAAAAAGAPATTPSFTVTVTFDPLPPRVRNESCRQRRRRANTGAAG